ncbi:hypothetical protein BKA58DRAFT_315089 [Alternaria rosae]|uniref:uncharacterized protein n=1 Tax=Alternaria rosae TaxID=1187941 RepID=UPI001E8D1CD3|nr:uncharacterized protein BKA58DRAFT_315089 [Alternaria rosae]KAH6870429.1 hypothetical protein BKA58DRAFT_315089 [Alternaria rosae]
MPFHDQDWEDLQRDCDIFPAYTDFIYGPDERLVVTQEPGLHPAIYYMNLPPPVRYTNSMPSRSWSYKTAERLETLEPAAMRELQHENYGFANADVTGTRSGSTTPGLDVRSQTGSPFYPLLPPQGVRTVHEKEIAQRSMSNASQRRLQPGSTVRFSPSQQQQQPVRLTRQQTQMRNAPVYQQPVGQQQKPSFLRSSSTTDIDENLAQINSRHQPTMLSPFTSPTPTLPPPITLPQQQPYTHQVYAQPPLQPGITPVQSSPSSSDPYYNMPHTPQQQMSPLQPPAFQGYPVSYPQDSTPAPNPTPPQLSVQLRAEINRHLLQVWQCLRVVLCTPDSPSEEAAQNKERAGRWIEQFKASLPIEGRPYLMRVISRMIKEHNAGGNVMALLGIPSRPA